MFSVESEINHTPHVTYLLLQALCSPAVATAIRPGCLRAPLRITAPGPEAAATPCHPVGGVAAAGGGVSATGWRRAARGGTLWARSPAARSSFTVIDPWAKTTTKNPRGAAIVTGDTVSRLLTGDTVIRSRTILRRHQTNWGRITTTTASTSRRCGPRRIWAGCRAWWSAPGAGYSAGTPPTLRQRRRRPILPRGTYTPGTNRYLTLTDFDYGTLYCIFGMQDT